MVNLLSTDEFYDLEKDPAENHNLIDAEETRVRAECASRSAVGLDERHPGSFPGLLLGGGAPGARMRVRLPGITQVIPASGENEPGEKRQLDYDTGLPMVDAVRKKEGLAHRLFPKREDVVDGTEAVRLGDCVLALCSAAFVRARMDLAAFRNPSF